MKVVVTGATGFIGRSLALALLRAGHQVTALARSPGTARSQLGAEVTVIDEGDDAAVGVAVHAADGVVNLAGENILARRWTAERKRALRASRVSTTARLVAHVLSRPTPLPVLISASAVGWYGDRGDELLDEQAAGGDDFAAEICREWEAAALAARRNAARVVLARLGIVLGGEGGALATMKPLFRLGLGGKIGDGAQWTSWIHLDDVTRAVLLMLRADGEAAPRLDGPVNLVAPGAVQNREFAAALGETLHRPAVLPVPGFALRLVMGERAQLLLGGQRVAPRALREAGFTFRYPELTAALDEALVPDDDIALGVLRTPLPGSPYLAAHPARYQLTSSTVIHRPIKEVFAFFSAAANLGAVTPPDMRFAITSAQPIEMRPGAVIDYRIRATGVPLRWRTVIDAWEPPAPLTPELARFVDSQTKGPYASWWHEHRFVQQGERTVMEDRVLYSPPLGWLGRIANWLLIRGELRRIFTHRGRVIRLRFGSDDATTTTAAGATTGAATAPETASSEGAATPRDLAPHLN